MESRTIPPPFLDADTIAQNCAEAQLGHTPTQQLLAVAQRILADPHCLMVVRAAHHYLYDTEEDDDAALQQADLVMGADAELLHALLILDSMRLVREKHHERGVPGDISWAVNQRHAVAWLTAAISQRGHVGIREWHPAWFRTVGSGELYRLGRLEFVLQAWEEPFRVYTHVDTHEVIVLAEAGQRLTDDGYLVGPTTWTTTFVTADDGVRGHPVSPRGNVHRDQVRLPQPLWQVVLAPGDWILDLHVPAEGDLTLAALRDALQLAEGFFEQFYPQQPVVAYLCDSWLFSPQLETMLPPDSRILRWQHEGYLLPSESGSDTFLAFTFGSPTIDLATAPRDTRLRRAVIDHLAANKPLRCGAWLLLRRDRDRFGAQPYDGVSDLAIARLRKQG